MTVLGVYDGLVLLENSIATLQSLLLKIRHNGPSLCVLYLLSSCGFELPLTDLEWFISYNIQAVEYRLASIIKS